MKKTILSLALLATTSVAQAGPWTVLTDWDYINEAGFVNAQTGYADEGAFADPWGADATAIDIPGVTTTVDAFYNPVDSTATADPAALDSGAGTVVVPGEHYVDSQGYNWFYNSDAGAWFNYGTSTSSEVGTTGTSHNGETTILERSQFLGLDVFDSACWGLDNQPKPSCVVFEDDNGNDSSRIEGTATTGMYGNQTFSEGTAITHQNNPAGAPSLTSILLADGLQISNSELATGSYLAPELFIPINFVETFEGSNSLWPEAPDDMFILDFGFGNTPIDIEFGPGYLDFVVDVVFDNSDFAANGEDYHKEYQVTTRLSGLEFFQSSNGQVAGILTEEGQDNTLNAQFAITAINVPEPTTIGFFGLSLLGLAGLARRKKA
jgi:hypothetical protein